LVALWKARRRTSRQREEYVVKFGDTLVLARRGSMPTPPAYNGSAANTALCAQQRSRDDCVRIGWHGGARTLAAPWLAWPRPALCRWSWTLCVVHRASTCVRSVEFVSGVCCGFVVGAGHWGARGDAPVTDTTMMVAEGSSPSRSTRVMSCAWHLASLSAAWITTG